MANEKTNNSILKPEHLLKIYDEFCKDLPKEGIRTGQTETGEQLIMIGYQFYINRLNDVVGIDHWQLEEIKENTLVERIGVRHIATVKVILSLGNYERGVFVPIVRKSSYGSGIHDVTRANALKGAFTNGFKKAAAMYGIGKKEYEGLVEDFEMVESGKQKITKSKVDLKGVPDEELEQTKAVEQLLLNSKTEVDLNNAKKVFDKIKEKLDTKGIKHLTLIFEKMERKIKK